MSNTINTGTVAYNITYTDTTSVTMGYLPPNSSIKNIRVNVGTGFDEAVVDIGDATTANQYANDVDVESTGSATVTMTNIGAVVSATNSSAVTAIVVPTSTTLTEGSCWVYVDWVQA